MQEVNMTLAALQAASFQAMSSVQCYCKLYWATPSAAGVSTAASAFSSIDHAVLPSGCRPGCHGRIIAFTNIQATVAPRRGMRALSKYKQSNG